MRATFASWLWLWLRLWSGQPRRLSIFRLPGSGRAARAQFTLRLGVNGNGATGTPSSISWIASAGFASP